MINNLNKQKDTKAPSIVGAITGVLLLVTFHLVVGLLLASGIKYVYNDYTALLGLSVPVLTLAQVYLGLIAYSAITIYFTTSTDVKLSKHLNLKTEDLLKTSFIKILAMLVTVCIYTIFKTILF